MYKLRRGIVTFGLAAFLSLLPSAASFAQTSSSSSYSTREYYFGNGGEVNLNSTNYKARGSAGAAGVGNASSTNYFTQTGFTTPQEEYLEMVINTSVVDLGSLATSTTGSGTATFYVRAYTSSGYYVQTVSGTPTNGTNSLAGMTSTGASSQGSNQFGINLRANTSPTTFGADPAPQPNSGYAYGIAATGYNTPNQFKYVQGDTIVTSAKGIGQTNYTISYIANVSAIMTAGEYSVEHILVVVATY